MQYFSTAQDFLALWEIDLDSQGAQDFQALAEVGALMMHYYQYRVTISKLARLAMHQQGLSPKVYWSRMKAAIRPIFDADPATLRALGVMVGGDLTTTCPILAEAVAEVLEPLVKSDSETAGAAAAVAKEVDALAKRTSR